MGTASSASLVTQQRCAPCRPTGALGASFPLMTRQKLKSNYLNSIRTNPHPLNYLYISGGVSSPHPQKQYFCGVIYCSYGIHRIWPYIWWFPCQNFRIYTVYDRIFGDSPANNTVYTPYMTVYLVISLPTIPYIHRIWPYIWWFPCQKFRIYTVYDRIFGDFPVKNTVYTPYMTVYIWWFPCQKHHIYTPCI